jgi:hypothetical protein
MLSNVALVAGVGCHNRPNTDVVPRRLQYLSTRLRQATKFQGPRPASTPGTAGHLVPNAFEDSRNTPATSDAHRHERVVPADTMQFIHCLDRQDGARRADRMTKRDSAAVRIRPLGRQAEVTNHRKCLRGKGFVYLK